MKESLQYFFVHFIIGIFITSICILFANLAEVNNESIFMAGVFISAVWGILSFMRKEAEMELEMENDASNQELNNLEFKNLN